MTEFYTNVSVEGNYILYRGVNNGRKVQKKESYQPKLYIKSNKGYLWKTLEGHVLEEKKFPSIFDARNFVKKYQQIEQFKIYGNQRYHYGFISDRFPDQIEHDVSLITVAYIDIEVNSSNGFPEPERADEPVTAITMYVNGQNHVFGYDEFNPGQDTKYYKCSDEMHLIKEFLAVWMANCPDIVTGWNVNMFDIPYLINRTIKLMGESEASSISPWNKISMRVQKIGNKEHQMYEISGIAILDYIDLYKKFSPTPNQESYKLDHIAEVEINEKKIGYSEYGSLHNLMEKNYQLFMEYNVHDVTLIRKMDDKLRLLELAMTLAYNAKVNFDDVFSQVRMWDTIIFNKLKSRHIAVPPNDEHHKAYQYAGAYVKDPEPGFYHWLASFDLTSLYPHLIMMYNLSPETLLQIDDYPQEVLEFIQKNGQISVDKLINREYDLNFLKPLNLTMTPNGQFFRTDIQGFLGELMEHMYNSRALYKKKELEAKKQIEKTDDPLEKARLKKEAARYKALQSAFKVTLNSAYGAIGNQYFRFFDVRIAEAVTLSGQMSIRWIQKEINDYFNKILKTNGDYVIASDTDSIYLSMDLLMKSVMKDMTEPKKVIDVMDKICEQKIKPFIDKSYDQLSEYVNAYAQRMIMKREALADKAIWTAKKRYILSVYNNEGVAYNEPDIKITGLEAIKSSTPKICKAKLKEVIKLIMTNGTEDDVIEFVMKFNEEFKKLPVIDICRPSGINGVGDYKDKRTIFQKGTPVHVKGALVFNHYIQHFGLEKQYEEIKDKDKIKWAYLKDPNPFQSNVIAFIDQYPAEFELEKYVDRDMQFTKNFQEPLELILDSIGWRLEKQNSLEDFFS